VRATQFFEFIASIAIHRRRRPLIQSIAAADVSVALAEIVVQPPVNGAVEVGGLEKFKLIEIVLRALEANQDARQVVGDAKARYFGAELNDKSLVAEDGALIGPTRYEEWLRQSLP
jgi:hypothetical protein